jgi:hypothetical protein
LNRSFGRETNGLWKVASRNPTLLQGRPSPFGGQPLKRKTGRVGEEVDSSAEPKTLRSTSMCPIRKPLHACLPKNIIQMGKHLRIECDTIKTGLHLF